jgi:hypothetical protein
MAHDKSQGLLRALKSEGRTMLAKQDAYAKGLVKVGDEHLDLTPELDLTCFSTVTVNKRGKCSLASQ